MESSAGLPKTKNFGGKALAFELARGSSQQIRPVSIPGPAVVSPCAAWPLTKDGERAGQITSADWPPDFQTNVAIGMVGAGR
ncbi:hypothetical protein [Leisingera sp. F5]|uniref:hypothetical protein n=1 Tax=Leisingera sp. F5 TaxID=1813816 RepID=UPI0025BE5EDA|nr:hypothetical protein [Leisingera sp. F5]